MDYGEILNSQKNKLDSSVAWWPDYFYHFTDIQNAIGIIEEDWIYARSTAVEKSVMYSDNASQNVINITLEDTKNYARLYFRPLTPTQYHNEGFKPSHVRKSDINANCPVPVFFCLSPQRILQNPQVGFVEKGMAGTYHEPIKFGVKEFSRLNFEKIYHNGVHEKGSDITQYRHSEIVCHGGIPIDDSVAKIICRSLAEKQTLLYLLQRQLPYKYKKYYSLIEYNPNLNMFFRNGVFVQRIEQNTNGLYIELNDAQLRFGKEKAIGLDVKVDIVLYWVDIATTKIMKREQQHCMLDYTLHTGINVPLQNKYSNLILLEIKFDDILMFKDYINLSSAIVI